VRQWPTGSSPISTAPAVEPASIDRSALGYPRQSCLFAVTYEQRYLFLSASGLTSCCHVTAQIPIYLSYVAWLSRESAIETFMTLLGGGSRLTEESRTYTYAYLHITTCIIDLLVSQNFRGKMFYLSSLICNGVAPVSKLRGCNLSRFPPTFFSLLFLGGVCQELLL